MEKAVIFSTNNLAALLYYHIQKHTNAPTIAAFVVDRQYRQETSFHGLPVECTEDMSELFPPEEFGVYNCVGYKTLNQGRREVAGRLKMQGYRLLNYLHPTACVDAQEVGEGNLFFQNVIVDPYTNIGDGNIFLANAFLAHHCEIGHFNFFSASACIAGRVVIKDQCYFGMNSSSKDKITIGTKVLVGMNASIQQDTPDETLIAATKCSVLEGKSRLAVL